MATPEPPKQREHVGYLRSLHSSRAYFQILHIVDDGQIDYGYWLTCDRSNRCAVLAPELLASMRASEKQFGIEASEHCLLDLAWRPPQEPISLGGLLVLMLSAIMHSYVRGSAASYQPNGIKAASQLAARVAAEIDRGGLKTEAAPNDHLVLRCGGLLHPRLPPAAKRLAGAVLRSAKDVNVRCQGGSTLMMICAEDFCMSGASLFQVLHWLHTKHACDWNAQDERGNTPMHEIVDGGDVDCLFLLLEHQLPGVDCYVRNNNGDTFMDVAKKLLHADKPHMAHRYELLQELCAGWVRHWQSCVRTALQPHLPVHSDNNNKGSVLAEIVMEFIDGTGEPFDKAERAAAVDAEIEEMLAAPVALPIIDSSL